MRRYAVGRFKLTALMLGLACVSLVAEMKAGETSAPTRSACQQCGRACPGCQLVECTVMVPMEVCETRMKPYVVKEQVEREETYTVFRCVPVKRTYYREQLYLVDAVKTKEITDERCHVVDNYVERTFKVQIPEKAVREVLEQKQVCTKDGIECIDVPCEREVIVLREETRTCPTTQKQVVVETCKRTIDYCTKEPKIHKEICTEDTICTLQPVEKTRKVTVCVPKVVERPVNVMVCRMVPQAVSCCPKCAKHAKVTGGKGGKSAR